MVWYSVRPGELHMQDPVLLADLIDVVNSSQQLAHPGEQPDGMFVLRADTVDPDSLYIHVGAYTPNAENRFTLRLLRWRIDNGGAEVKPRGVAAGYQPLDLTPAQQDVMVRALDFMTVRSEQMNALAEFGGNNDFVLLPVGMAMAGGMGMGMGAGLGFQGLPLLWNPPAVVGHFDGGDDDDDDLEDIDNDNDDGDGDDADMWEGGMWEGGDGEEEEPWEMVEVLEEEYNNGGAAPAAE
ncbi:hypothetical protein Agub_g2125 [Astrephomene gubernaculifera]|uniref:Uncharacterized protein n=1 Tax=Astrephomene gubernaculifera TaxID=47775 RepID=A0AAD3DIQ4_9CHLO|nr:hypothetical protein Agub_g2125 [Astrephomene gubernaculifera]